MNLYFKKAIFYPLFYSNLYLIPYKVYSFLQSTNMVLFLTYHRVLPRSDVNASLSQRSLIMSLESFRQQLDILNKSYSVISLDEYFSLKKKDIKRRKKPFAIITFDDGWADNYIFALEELYRKRLPATVYLTSGLIGTSKLFWPENLFLSLLNYSAMQPLSRVDSFIAGRFNENVRNSFQAFLDAEDFISKKECANKLVLFLKEYGVEDINQFISLLKEGTKESSCTFPDADRLLRWEEVVEMLSCDVTFGSHTETHTILTNVSLECAEQEIVRSKKYIESKIQRPVLDFSYPNGSYNEEVYKLLQKSGYRSAVTGINSLSTLKADAFALQRKGNNELRVIERNGQLNTALTLLEWSNFIGFLRGLKKNRYH